MPDATAADSDPFFAIIRGGEWNACIGKQSTEENYVDGYMEAALELASAVIDKRQYGKRDTLAMPILYNARHAVELALKFVIDRLVEAGIVPQAHPKTHDIKSHWDMIDRAPLGDVALRQMVDGLKIFVDSLHGIDEGGQQLRYAETQDGQKSLQDKAICNLELIRGSLRDLQRLLTELRYRAIDVVDECQAGAFTPDLSRRDLFALTAMLPPRDCWDSDAFTEAKTAACARFGLSSNKFSKALDVIKAHPQMGSRIGLEFPLAHLTDADLHHIVSEWAKANPERTEAREPVDYFKIDRDEMAVYWKASAAADQAILAALPPEKVADMQAIYYLGHLRLFSEEYPYRLTTALKELKAGETPREMVHHIMTKSDLPRALARGVEILGRPKLAAALRAIRKDFAD